MHPKAVSLLVQTWQLQKATCHLSLHSASAEMPSVGQMSLVSADSSYTVPTSQFYTSKICKLTEGPATCGDIVEYQTGIRRNGI